MVASQHWLPAAHDLGLAAKWRTRDAPPDPRVKHLLGFHPVQHVIAFRYFSLRKGIFLRPNVLHLKIAPSGWIDPHLD
jgi:hypothetical protein